MTHPDLASARRLAEKIVAGKHDDVSTWEDLLASALLAALEDVEWLYAALDDQVERWGSVPSGVDLEAEEGDPSPKDVTAHIAGLAIRAARAARDGTSTSTSQHAAVSESDGKDMSR